MTHARYSVQKISQPKKRRQSMFWNNVGKKTASRFWTLHFFCKVLLNIFRKIYFCKFILIVSIYKDKLAKIYCPYKKCLVILCRKNEGSKNVPRFWFCNLNCKNLNILKNMLISYLTYCINLFGRFTVALESSLERLLYYSPSV